MWKNVKKKKNLQHSIPQKRNSCNLDNPRILSDLGREHLSPRDFYLLLSDASPPPAFFFFLKAMAERTGTPSQVVSKAFYASYVYSLQTY